ncbi:MAG: tetratricopeptide repeat protein [Marinilabiliales bacterium]|nr:tetratricopeptide repeat protein [Marinilabiliales bacterium]
MIIYITETAGEDESMRFRIIVFLVFLLAFVSGRVFGQTMSELFNKNQSVALKEVDRGRELLDKGKLDKARAAFEKALALGQDLSGLRVSGNHGI